MVPIGKKGQFPEILARIPKRGLGKCHFWLPGAGFVSRARGLEQSPIAVFVGLAALLWADAYVGWMLHFSVFALPLLGSVGVPNAW